MPIDFNCPTCQKLLRVPDGAAGRQAKCPQCGNVVLVPAAGASNPSVPLVPPSIPPASPIPPVPPADQLMSDEEEFRIAPPTATPSYKPQVDNPFASPASVGVVEEPLIEGDGPPWESQGPSVGSFLETVKLVFGNPNVMFSTMRRVGGLGLPLGYAVVSTMIGFFFYAIFETLQRSMLGNALHNRRGGAAMDLTAAAGGVICGTFILVPVLVAIFSFVSAGIYHLLLMMLDGARQPFETTYRVQAYAAGTGALLNAVPCVGIFVAGIVTIGFTIIGLSKAHNIPTGKAAIAVLIPFAICCGCSLALGALLGFGAFAALRQ